MTKHSIEVEGLPEGWEPVAFREPVPGEHIFSCNKITLLSGFLSEKYLIVQKTKPRRIVFEETGEIRRVEYKEFYIYLDGSLRQYQDIEKSDECYKICRIKEE